MCKCAHKRVRQRTSGLPSSMEFYHVKANVSVPENGWTQSQFRTQNGVRLLQSILRVKRAAMARGTRNMNKLLKEYFVRQLNEVVKRVRLAAEANSYKATITISVDEHEQLWQQAIESVFREGGMQLRLEVAPTLQSVGVEVHRKTSVLIGAPWSDATNQAMQRRAMTQAAQVTRIHRHTRERLSRELNTALAEGKTVRETIDLIRERIPSIGATRIPTIVRTELSRATDSGIKQALKDSEVVTHVSVVGCEAIEPNIPEYNGIPTCNIEDVPIEDVDELEFHPNHTGTIVPSRFRDDEGRVVSREDGSPVAARSGSGEVDQVVDE